MARKDEARLNSTGKHPNKLHPKDNSFRSQPQTIFHYLIAQIAFASLMFSETRMPICLITCHKINLTEGRMFREVVSGKCRVAVFEAWFLSTDHEQARILINQLTLWP